MRFTKVRVVFAFRVRRASRPVDATSKLAPLATSGRAQPRVPPNVVTDMSRRTLAAAVLIALTAAAPAAADTLVAAAPGAKNLAVGGGWYAWAAPAPDGRWRLTIRNPDTGVVSVPDIPAFGAPPDAAIGSDVTGENLGERRLVVAYSRCEGRSTISGCDVWSYDIASGEEAEVDGLASTGASETAPSVSLGTWSYVRRGAIERKGVYVRTREDRSRRLSSTIARETSTNGSRVAYAYNSSAGGGVALRRASGEGGVDVLTSRREEIPRSLVTTRYRAAWLEGDNPFQTTRFGGSGGPRTPEVVPQARPLPDTVDSIATNGSIVFRYLDERGVASIDPPLFPNT